MATEHEVLVVPQDIRCTSCGMLFLQELSFRKKEILLTCMTHNCDLYEKELIFPLRTTIVKEKK